MSNYFELLEQPLALNLDLGELRRVFLRKSRAYHPDFHSQADEAQREAMLLASTQINEAYRCLSDFDSRLQALLNLSAAPSASLPPAFLAEVMSLNEQLMELAFEDNPQALKAALSEQVQALEAEAEAEIQPYLGSLPTEDSQERAEMLQALSLYAQKRPYFRRLKQALTNG